MARSAELDGETPVGDGTDPGSTPDGTAPDVDDTTGAAGDPLKRFLARVYRFSAVLAVVGTIAARVAGADLLAVNFLIGSLVGLSMLYITAWLVRRYVAPGVNIKRNRNRLFLLLMAKLPLLGAVIFVVTSRDWFHPIGLLLGVSMIPFTLTLCGLILLLRQGAADDRGDWTAVLNSSKRSYR